LQGGVVVGELRIVTVAALNALELTGAAAARTAAPAGGNVDKPPTLAAFSTAHKDWILLCTTSAASRGDAFSPPSDLFVVCFRTKAVMQRVPLGHQVISMAVMHLTNKSNAAAVRATPQKPSALPGRGSACIALGTADRKLLLVGRTEGQSTLSMICKKEAAHCDAVAAVAFCPLKEIVVTASDNYIALWRLDGNLVSRCVNFIDCVLWL
jgi:hypothetical protein